MGSGNWEAVPAEAEDGDLLIYPTKLGYLKADMFRYDDWPEDQGMIILPDIGDFLSPDEVATYKSNFGKCFVPTALKKGQLFLYTEGMQWCLYDFGNDALYDVYDYFIDRSDVWAEQHLVDIREVTPEEAEEKGYIYNDDTTEWWCKRDGELQSF